MTLQQQLIDGFIVRFGQPPAAIVRAPGRVNIIGEHTDYNDGFVLPMAIDRATWIALRPREDHIVHVSSLNFDGQAEFALDNLQHESGFWAEYIKGVAWALNERGYQLRGWDGVVASDVPMGAGLSSSAALELATARAFALLSSFPWDSAQMALVGQKAENGWVGMNCGIMDQMISAAGKADHALLIDCRSLETALVPLPVGTVVVVLDTSTRRGLVDSAYNERRSSCEAVARFFGVKALRDLSYDEFVTRQTELDNVQLRRARHVITENQRVLQAVSAMRRGDAVELGQLMDASHLSMRDDFEISSPALNSIVTAARRQPGCYGARMTGGGFAGCGVALVASNQAQIFAEQVAVDYKAETGLTPAIYVCKATDGASVVG